MNDKIVEFMPKVVGKFGFEEEQELGLIFGMNAKGDMDDTEFEKFIFTQ